MTNGSPDHRTGNGSNVELVTFGCRLNHYESDAIAQYADVAGLGDTVVVNTCAVTSEAARQARQSIRRLYRERPGVRIVVTGCAAQVDPQSFAAMPEVAQVIGNDEKMKPETWARMKTFDAAASERILVDDIMSVRETAGHLVDGMRGRTRAFVQVQNGCDHRCTFCIIPYGRGNSRSVPMGVVVDQIRTLSESGAREVVLTGVDITSYGRDLPGDPRLGALIKAILRHVPELERLRISSIDSVEADDDLLDALANDKRLMPHLHLSLQAGDDLILKRMKRRHLREDAIRFCEEVRRIRPDIVFGADIITGFPTEDEAMFTRSLDLVDECGLTHLHVFPFSPRPGTPAARMPQVPRDIAKARAARLRERGEAALRAHLDGEIGKRRSVLIESTGMGRTEAFTPVRFHGPSTRGEIRDVLIAGHARNELIPA